MTPGQVKHAKRIKNALVDWSGDDRWMLVSDRDVYKSFAGYTVQEVLELVEENSLGPQHVSEDDDFPEGDI